MVDSCSDERADSDRLKQLLSQIETQMLEAIGDRTMVSGDNLCGHQVMVARSNGVLMAVINLKK